MELRLTHLQSETSFDGVIKINSNVFNAPFNEPLIHQAITAYLDGNRSQSRVPKNRSQVHASNAKPWRQKGTGRARAGSVKSPLWRGGGVTFASKKTHGLKLNRKMRKGALRSILSELIRQERLFVTEQIFLEAPKTGVLRKILLKNHLENVLIVLKGDRRQGTGESTPNQEQEAVFRAATNLPTVLVLEADQIDPVSLIRAKNVLFTKAALIQLEELLS